MDIREFRAVIGSAFKEQDFLERCLTRGSPKYWTLPGGEIVPFFAPHALLAVYRTRREELGWLAHPYQKPAWDFLLRWWEDPAPELRVPRMLPDGRIA